MRPGSIAFLLIGVALLAGCAGGLRYTATGPTYPPRGTAGDVKLFDRVEPPEPYERLGQLTWEYRRSKFTPPRLTEVLPELRRKAWEVGGDALIVRRLKEPPDPEGTLEVAADVVRWKR
jgi:hypothetical protein